MPPARPMAVCLTLTRAISLTRTVEEIYEIALDALEEGLGVSRASILLFDKAGVMRFLASRRLSQAYREAVEGHTPWTPDSPHPEPIVVGDVERDPSLAPLLEALRAEGIGAMAFIPLVSLGRVVGKFMVYFDAPHVIPTDELELASVIASQVAFAVERMRSEERSRRDEERLRFALDAASMGTWDWDLEAGTVQWSDNLERVHGLPPGTFDGTFGSYEREIHPDDRNHVLASARRAMAEGIPHEVEYRIVSPDGTVRWVEGKGRVEYRDGAPVRMTGVCMVVTGRKEAELARLAAAEEASRLKDEFLATLSHELRTPLNAILGWAEMLRGGALAADRARGAVDIIARNAVLQGHLIEDILDVSRIITGKLDIEPVTVLVPPLVDTVVAGIMPAAQAREIAIIKNLPGDLPPIDGDPRRLQQVLGNVLSNAIKFTPPGGRIEIRAAWRPGWVEIEVQDSGEGVAPDFLPFLFDRFSQADSRATRRHGGLGLGLAIARHIVELHRGQIEARSDGVGCGTTIAIRLPVETARAALPGDTRPWSQPNLPAGLRLSGVTAVVVDDQADSCDLVATLLEQLGGRAVRCHSAQEALDAMRKEPIRLLVADIAMPGVDGHELIRRVRRLYNGVPAVAVSAFARPEDRLRALECGYDRYCAKPLDMGHFLQTLRGLLTPPA